MPLKTTTRNKGSFTDLQFKLAKQGLKELALADIKNGKIPQTLKQSDFITKLIEKNKISGNLIKE